MVTWLDEPVVTEPAMDTDVVTGWGAGVACGGAVMSIVAHEDDDLIFQSPDLLHDVQAGRRVGVVYVTAGDAGNARSWWSKREGGPRAAYARMAGVADVWATPGLTVAGRSLRMQTLVQAPNVSLVFLRLPDGSRSGSGYRRHGHQSLKKLWDGALPVVSAVDGSASYTATQLTSALTELMNHFRPATVRTLDFTRAGTNGDHSDHRAVALFTRRASRFCAVEHRLVAYEGYRSVSHPVNVGGADLDAKRAALMAYASVDRAVYFDAILGRSMRARLQRQVVLASICTGQPAAGFDGGPGASMEPTLRGTGGDERDAGPQNGPARRP